MKIAVFSDAYSPQINGVVTHLLSTLPLLAEKHQICLFVPDMSAALPKELKHKNITVKAYKGVPMPVYEKILLTSPFHPLVLRALKLFKPDVIHIHTPFTMGSNGIIAARRYNMPLVETFHTYVNEPEYLRHFKLNKIGMDKSQFVQEGIWSVLDLFYEPADLLICPSEITKKDIVARYPHKSVDVISNGIELRSFKAVPPTKEVVLKKFGIVGPYLLYVGRMSVEKNIRDLVSAYMMSGLSAKGVSLVIAGKGHYENKIKESIKEKGGERIVLLGELTHKEVVTSGILHHAIAFVSASTSETQGISFLEAMAAGLPLIVAESKASAELVEGNGLLCRPNSPEDMAAAMKKIYEDAALRENFARKSREIIKKHDIHTTISLLEEAYKKAMSLHARTDVDTDPQPLQSQ